MIKNVLKQVVCKTSNYLKVCPEFSVCSFAMALVALLQVLLGEECPQVGLLVGAQWGRVRKELWLHLIMTVILTHCDCSFGWAFLECI